ncbi:MAG: hypothetical protein J6A25_00480 [Lachnospiraceae bacterium]|nr:hypothetical protein [Lachnospiraceae bacterium]
MNITKLNESKDKLDMNIVASLNAEAWNYLVTLRTQKEGLKKDFKGTNKLIEAMEELEDAHLIYLGQLEAILADNGIEPISKEEKEADKDTLKEDLETLVINEPIINVNLNVAPEDEKFEDECEPCKEEKPNSEAFEFYCDFDDPTPGPAIQTPWQGIIK